MPSLFLLSASLHHHHHHHHHHTYKKRKSWRKLFFSHNYGKITKPFLQGSTDSADFILFAFSVQKLEENTNKLAVTWDLENSLLGCMIIISIFIVTIIIIMPASSIPYSKTSFPAKQFGQNNQNRPRSQLQLKYVSQSSPSLLLSGVHVFFKNSSLWTRCSLFVTNSKFNSLIICFQSCSFTDQVESDRCIDDIYWNVFKCCNKMQWRNLKWTSAILLYCSSKLYPIFKCNLANGTDWNGFSICAIGILQEPLMQIDGLSNPMKCIENCLWIKWAFAFQVAVR